MKLDIAHVKEAHDLWFKANTRCNDRKQLEREMAEKNQKSVTTTEVVDFSDIDKLFEEKKQGSHMLEMEFEPVTDAPEEYESARTGKLTQRWTWRHKITGFHVKRFLTQSKKSWDTGKLSEYLKKIKPDEKAAYDRAQRILELNRKNVRVTEDAVIVATVPKCAFAKEVLVRQWVRTNCCVHLCLETII